MKAIYVRQMKLFRDAKPVCLGQCIAGVKTNSMKPVSWKAENRGSLKLPDGVFSCSSEFLKNNNLQFDEMYNFHFYDLDLYRQVEQKGACMETWCISLVHESGGGLNSPQWQTAKENHLAKWGN